MSPDLCRISFMESTELPERTLIAPLDVIREIRLTLGELALDVRVGLTDAVIVSSDLYAAFAEWSRTTSAQDSWLN